MNLLTNSDHCFPSYQVVVKKETSCNSMSENSSLYNFMTPRQCGTFLPPSYYDFRARRLFNASKSSSENRNKSRSSSPDLFSTTLQPSGCLQIASSSSSPLDFSKHLYFDNYPRQQKEEFFCVQNFDSSNNLFSIECKPDKLQVEKRERKRTHNINSAYSALRNCIPNVPSDTKLSKIKTLRLATSYISYLMDVLSKDDPNTCCTFDAEAINKVESKLEKRKKEEISKLLPETSGNRKSHKIPRTGWPQQVWAAEFKTEKLD